MPRYYIIPIGESGVRIEDLFLILYLPVLLFILYRHRAGWHGILIVFTTYVSIIIISAIYSQYLGRIPITQGLMYGLKPILYTSAFAIGYYLTSKYTLGRKAIGDVVGLVLIINLLYGAGVWLNFLPNVSSFAGDRLSGLTNGPYELSAIACIACVLFMSSDRRYVYLISVVALGFTQARIAFAAFAFQLWGFFATKRIVLKITLILITSTVLFAALNIRSSEDNNLLQALESGYEILSRYTQPVSNSEEYFLLAYSEGATTDIANDGQGDLSAVLRIIRWSVVFTTGIHAIDNFLIGMGPGFYSVALDGNYVRIFGETGIIGLIIFIIIGKSIISLIKTPLLNALLRSIVFQLAIIGVFIDIFASLKVMSLFWMIFGALYRDSLDQKLPLKG